MFRRFFKILFTFIDVIIYRVFRYHEKKIIKKIHAILHLLTLALFIVGAYTVFSIHDAKGTPNLYSLHSWFGLITMVLFFFQVSQPKTRRRKRRCVDVETRCHNVETASCVGCKDVILKMFLTRKQL